MLRRTERILENIPVGSLGMIALPGCEDLGKKVDNYLVQWRHESGHEYKDDIAFSGYEKDTYLVDARVPRFGSGEAKGILGESVRGKDLYLLVDVCNYSVTYSLTGQINHMSPDDHFQNLKRIIAAIGGKGRRINVIMPFLYESRQHKRNSRESLDCALALQELVRMGEMCIRDSSCPGCMLPLCSMPSKGPRRTLRLYPDFPPAPASSHL